MTHKVIRLHERQVQGVAADNLFAMGDLDSQHRMKLARQISTISIILGFPPNRFLEHAVAWTEDGRNNVYAIEWSDGEIVGHMLVEHPKLVDFFGRCNKVTIN